MLCGVQEIPNIIDMLGDLARGRQNDNKAWRCHAEHSEASRFGNLDTLAEILTPLGVLRDPPSGRQNDNGK